MQQTVETVKELPPKASYNDQSAKIDISYIHEKG